MNNNEINTKLKEIKTENFIWIIYIGIIILSWYSNFLEKKYFLYNDLESKDKYRKTLILIFSILIIVYLYFFYDSFESFKDLKTCDTQKKKDLTSLSLLASTLILISGLIFLYIAIKDEDINVEIAFN